MDQFIIDHNKNQDSRISTFYTIIGKQDSLDENKNPIAQEDSDQIFAKKITVNNKTKHYIKVGAYGKILNPIGLYSEGTVNKFIAKTGKKAWDFKEVNVKVFDMYVSFLRTKNLAWLNNAEREML